MRDHEGIIQITVSTIKKYKRKCSLSLVIEEIQVKIIIIMAGKSLKICKTPSSGKITYIVIYCWKCYNLVVILLEINITISIKKSQNFLLLDPGNLY